MLTQRVCKVKLEKRGIEAEEERKYKQLVMFSHDHIVLYCRVFLVTLEGKELQVPKDMQ